MKRDLFRIAEGGEERLREAIAAKIRAKYEALLSTAGDRRQRAEIKQQIKREMEQAMKRIASPYSLWGSRL